MKKALSIYLENPVIKQGTEFYKNLVKQRIAESRTKNPEKYWENMLNQTAN